ncbi:MAG TPA: lysozyme [Streptosporangiaceae bacterium]|nr:lysozyme [Streptosporangiaceae bacterium]
MSLPGQSGRPSLRKRAAAAAASIALIGGAVAAGTTPAQAGVEVPVGDSTLPVTWVMTAGSGHAAPTSTAPSHVAWARTVSGQEVKVTTPKFVATPIRPEKITHPGRDFMGSTVAARFSAKVNRKMAQAASVPQLPGIDVSGYQGDINWGGIARYLDFSYAKATEGTYYTNPYFYNQYQGPYQAYLKRGAYHFAIPNNSSGEAQASYFIAHGGGWSGDGRTLPGALDIEYNPYGSECYGLTQSQMVSWVRDFVNEYAYKEHAYPVIYTTTDWWSTCTGNYSGFGKYDPLWIANYSASHGGTLPRGWGFYTFWQYRDSGSLPGDQDVFNGAYSQLKVIVDRG